jgi:hypothetical protein
VGRYRSAAFLIRPFIVALDRMNAVVHRRTDVRLELRGRLKSLSLCNSIGHFSASRLTTVQPRGQHILRMNVVLTSSRGDCFQRRSCRIGSGGGRILDLLRMIDRTGVVPGRCFDRSVAEPNRVQRSLAGNEQVGIGKGLSICGWHLLSAFCRLLSCPKG